MGKKINTASWSPWVRTHDDFGIFGGTHDDGTHDELAGPMTAGTNDAPRNAQLLNLGAAL